MTDTDYMGNPIAFSETLIGGLQEDFEDYDQSEPLTYSEDPPLTYTMDVPKVKEISPNQAFSSKDFDLIMKLQNNYNIPFHIFCNKLWI